MPVVKNFRATTIWRAFILNSFAVGVAVVVAIFLKDIWDKENNSKHVRISTKQMLITFASTMLALFLAYSALHFFLGFGGGMLIQE